MASTDFCSNLFDEDKGVNEVVSEFISGAIQAFETKVDDIFLSTLDVPYATELAMMKVQKLIELAMLEHDGIIVEVDEALEVLTPDGEPAPSTIDSWARGTVAVKKVSAEEHHGIPHSFNNETPSISSAYTGKSSANGRGSSRASSRGTARTGLTTGKLQDADTTGKIIELEDDGEGDFADLGATGYMFDMLQKSKRKKENGFIEKDTEKGEFTLLQEQMEQAKKELRGKKFALDRYGKPVVLGSINADKLAPYSTAVGLNIKSAGADLDLDNMSTGSAASKGSKGQAKDSAQDGKDKKKKHFVRVAGSRGVDESSFKPTLSLAVTLSGVEHIPKLNPGVSVRSSTSVRSGDKLPEDPKHISRKQYMSQSLSRRSAAGDGSTLDSMSRTLDASSFYTSDPSRVGEKSMYSVQSGGSKGSPSKAGRVMQVRSMEGIPDLDRMEGSRPVPRNVVAFHDASDEELGLGPVNTKGTGARQGTLPAKPSEKQQANIKLLAGSPENGKPRDRDMVKNMRPVTERKHLPAPPLGQISGHGLTVEKYIEKTKLTATEDDNWHQDWRVTYYWCLDGSPTKKFAPRLRGALLTFRNVLCSPCPSSSIEMNQQLIDQLESAPYDANTAASLEVYLTAQLANKQYDFSANKALLKNYQNSPSTAKPDFISKLLILSLMKLPSSDFLALTYMIPTQLTSNQNILTVQKCADALERGKFREFWELYVPAQALFAEAAGFVDAVRLFIVSNLRDTFKTIPKVLFQQQLGLDDVSVVSFCESNKFIEKISGDVIVLASNEENQKKSVREESVKLDESVKLVEFLRHGMAEMF